MLSPNQTVHLETQSGIYSGSYESIILNVSDTSIAVKTPYKNGKLVLLSVGTLLKVKIPDKKSEFFSEVIQRFFTPEPLLILNLPLHLMQRKPTKRTKFISITSGKGGVGKTSFTINLAISLSKLGYRTFIVDADLGTANVDVLLNLQPQYNLTHILNRQKDIMDVIIDGPEGIFLLPGGSGLQNIADLNEWQFNRLVNSFQTLEKFADIVLIDTGAGLSKNVINFVLASDEVILITTPEPHAITDAYAIIKVLNEQKTQLIPKLVLNRVENPEEAKQISDKIKRVTERFLTIQLEELGYILDDTNVLKAIKKLRPFVISEPQTPASLCIKNIAQKLTAPSTLKSYEIRKSFFHKVKELFKK